MPRSSRSRRKGVKRARSTKRPKRGKKVKKQPIRLRGELGRFVSVFRPKSSAKIKSEAESRRVRAAEELQRRSERRIHEQEIKRSAKFAPVSRPKQEIAIKQEKGKTLNPFESNVKQERKEASVKGRVTFTQVAPSSTLGIRHGGSSTITTTDQQLPQS